MPKISVLPESLANMIAAGEVVDRPSSVVKELVENSIDAGSGHIDILIEDAGKSLIVVEDDGEGMDREDAALSLKRHATSKIASASDLDAIATMGFRGEALPSIASVSRLTLVTRKRGTGDALEFKAEGGSLLPPRIAAAPEGTRVEVADLFFNTPARKKFLKSDGTELKNIVDSVTRLSLVHHGVGFTLRSAGRVLLSLPPGQTLAQRAQDAAHAPAPFYWHEAREGDRALVFAYLAPHEGKGRRDGLKFFVNRRPVTDRLLFAALMEGYKGILAQGHYPTAILWLTLNPALVDVNVHPAKREVRFADEGQIFRFVAGNVGKALSLAPWACSDGPLPPLGECFGASKGACAEAQGLARVGEALQFYGRSVSQRNEATPTGRGGFSGYRGFGGAGANAGLAAARPVSQTQPFGWEGKRRSSPLGNLRFLIAVDATYLAFTDEDTGELVIIDQHAAHERILYEKFLKAASGGAAVQRLLVPVVVELDPGRMALWEERKGALGNLGIGAEPFGSTAVSVLEAPAGFGGALIQEVVADFLSREFEGASAKGAEGVEKLAARAACKAAVKARQALHESEALELIENLGKTDNPSNCPHGRPLLLRLGREKLETLFHRR